jgi:hypothetical protein
MLEPIENQSFTVTDDLITINGSLLIHRDYYIPKKDFILDQLSMHYRGQRILILLLDGENYNVSGLEHFFNWCCNVLSIPHNTVTLKTQSDKKSEYGFNIETIDDSLFSSALRKLQPIDKDLSEAKFIGYTFGRFTMPRLRMAYELDKVFANDSYCEFSQTLKAKERFDYVWDRFEFFRNNYAEELDWYMTKKFDTHIDWADGVRQCKIWEISYLNYHTIWNKFKIEIIPETDGLDNFFITEKSGRCIASGKPFVLLSGKDSLPRFKEMGFQTYSSIIDESYDSAEYPLKRIQMMVKALQDVYNSPDRDTLISEMYKIADANATHYKTHIHDVVWAN